MGINVNGKKSVIERIFFHPDGKSIFIFISFPKIGILKTEDNGKTFKSRFFTLKKLEEYFEYSESEKDEKISASEKTYYDSLFASSQKYPGKIVLTFGSYLFITNDYGEKWFTKNIFFDDQKSEIIDLSVTKNDEIIVTTENKIGYSGDFGKTWKVNYIKIPKIDFFKLSCATGYYDNSTDTLYASIINRVENDSFLSRASYDFLYNEKDSKTQSGLYFSKDFGKTWQKTKINIPLSIWKYNGEIYASSIYPSAFYRSDIPDNLKKSTIFKTGKLDGSSTYKEDFLKILLSFKTEDYQIIPFKNNRIIKIKSPKEYEVFEETDFENVYNCLKKIENTPFIHKRIENNEKSNNFYYEYDPYAFFKLWNGFMIKSPVIYEKVGKTYYRVRPSEKYLNGFIRYSLENQIKLNGINPFLKRISDIEFFDPASDPTDGLPVIFERSTDNGISWNEVYDSKHIKNIIDPLGTKRNIFYWIKNVDEKKSFRLRISFGFGDSPNLIVYPSDVVATENDLLIVFRYFSFNKYYQDGYLLPIISKGDLKP